MAREREEEMKVPLGFPQLSKQDTSIIKGLSLEGSHRAVFSMAFVEDL